MTRSRGRTLAALPLLVAAGLVAFGCRVLEEIPEGVCGNDVLDVGEDCERFVPNGDPTFHCGDPGTNHACRFTCSRLHPAEFACPEGYACGGDGLCRTPSGNFDGVVQYPSLATSVAAGDFDVDDEAKDKGEVIATTPRRAVEVLGVGAGMVLRSRIAAGLGVPQTPVVPARESGAVALGVARTGGLVSVFKATDGPALQPEFYSAFHLANTQQFRLGTAEVLPGAAEEGGSRLGDNGDEAIVVIADVEGPRLSFVDGIMERRTIERLTSPVDKLAGVRLVAGRFDESLPCDLVPLPFSDVDSIEIAQLCRPGPPGSKVVANGLANEHVAPRKIMLEAGFVVGPGGVHVVDVDGDDHLDLVIDAKEKKEKEPPRATLVAFGLGDGRFHGSAYATPPVAPDGRAARADAVLKGCAKDEFLPAAKDEFPLAMGHLTDDKQVDCVLPHSVRYRTEGVRPRALLIDDRPELREAVIADVNGDGLNDVVALSGESIDVITSTGSYGHRRSQPASDPQHVSVGDIDGDLVADIAYSDKSNGKETITLLYGVPLGWPTSPVELGVTSDVRQILIGAVSNLLGGNDDVADLGVVTAGDQSFSVAMLRGNTARELEAPFALVEPGGTPLDRYNIDAIVTGRFLPTTRGRTDSMAVIAHRLGQHRLWLVPPGSTRLFDPEGATVAQNNLDPNYDYERARGAAGDLDGDGIDELVLVAPPKEEGRAGLAFVAKHDAGRLKVTSSFQLGVRHPSAAPDWQVVAADLDGAPGVEIAFRVDDGASSKVFVFFAEGAGLSSSGIELPLADVVPSSIAAIRLGTTRARTLLVGTTAGTIRTVALNGRTPELTATPVLKDLKTPRGLTAYDINGDGVEDLVIADGTNVSVHYGKPLNP